MISNDVHTTKAIGGSVPMRQHSNDRQQPPSDRTHTPSAPSGDGRSRLTWPAGAKRTGVRAEWFEKLSNLPPGLDLQEISRRLNEPYGRVYRWAQTFRYPSRRKTRVTAEQWDGVDWARRDAEIARDLGVSREYVRQVRASKNIGPGQRLAAVRSFREFVAARRDRLHHKPVAEVVRDSGQAVSPGAARRVLRQAGVLPPVSRWQGVDWRLSNRDLAAVWNTTAKYVANVRARLGKGPATWYTPSAKAESDPAYRDAMARERQKAKAKAAGARGRGAARAPGAKPADRGAASSSDSAEAELVGAS